MGPARASCADDGVTDLSRQMVVLRHETADRVHWDWLFARDRVESGVDMLGNAGEKRGLLAFRVHKNPAFGAGENSCRFHADAIPDHRLRYLVFEGELTGGRGQVRRVGAGWCQIKVETAAERHIRFRLDGITCEFAWQAVRAENNWQVTLARTAPGEALDLLTLLDR